MSGDDILYWLDGIWYDVTNLATADIPSLLFRLFVLFAAIVIGQQIIRIVLRICSDILRPVAQLIRDILKGIWWIVSAPVRVPRDWLRKRTRAKQDRKNEQYWEMQRQHKERQEAEEKDRQQEEAVEHIRRQGQELQRMKGMMNRLE